MAARPSPPMIDPASMWSSRKPWRRRRSSRQPDMANLEQNRKNDVLAENLLRAAGLSGDDLKSLAHVFKDASAHFCERLKHGCAAAFDVEAGAVESADDHA